MPVQGFKTITISVDVYTKLDAYATKTNRSIPGAVEHLVKNAAKSIKRAEKKEQLTQQNN